MKDATELHDDIAQLFVRNNSKGETKLMPDSNALINIGEISKPATVLIEKISDAVGGIFRPYQIRRVAEAEAQAEKIKVVSQIEITDLQRRALNRFMIEEAKKQDNIETITKKSLQDISDDARPQDIEDDWITNFFDKCRLISDGEMQQLWAKILAGQDNTPGRFSKRTIDLLSSLDKTDAQLFANLCAFGWFIGNVVPLIYDDETAIYTDTGITFNTLKHLDEIGLVSFDSLAGYRRIRLPQILLVRYYGAPVKLEFPKLEDNELQTGKVLLSKAGQELAPICGSKPVPGFKDFVLQKWVEMGIKVEQINIEPSTQRG